MSRVYIDASGARVGKSRVSIGCWFVDSAPGPGRSVDRAVAG